MTEPMILMSAPNGARRTKVDHPLLPMTADDLASTARVLVEGGVSILHMHVRDTSGRHTLDVGRYKEATKAVRKAIGDKLIIQITSEAVGIYSREEQMAIVKALKPEAVSLALRELCPREEDEVTFAAFNNWLIQEQVFPQFILYDTDDLNRFEQMRTRGVIPENPFVLLVMGKYNPTNTEDELMAARAFIEASKNINYPWAVCGFGKDELIAVKHAADYGGHTRVGFENSIWDRSGALLKDHGDMLKAATEAAITAGRSIATVEHVRERFSIS